MKNLLNDIRNEPNKQKYLKWLLGLFFICFCVSYEQVSDTNAPFYVIFLAATANFLLFIIIAFIIYFIFSFFLKNNFFKTFNKIFLWTMIICFAGIINNTIEKRKLYDYKNAKKYKFKTDFLNELKDSCVVKLNNYRPANEAESICSCVIEKAKNKWTESDINRDGFVKEKNVRDSMASWMTECLK
jgi:hypothetical protein